MNINPVIMKILFKSYAIFQLVILFSSSYGSVYYVDTNGNDNNPGTKSQPWASIQKGCNIAEAGDTVIIRDGVYHITREIHPVNSGNENNWITYMAFPDEKVRINANKFVREEVEKKPGFLHYGAFHIEGVSYVRLINIGVFNSHNTGIMVRGKGTHHIELLNCSVDETYSSGIGLWYADNIKVKNCEISRANNLKLGLTEEERNRGESPHEALTIAGATNFDVSYNHVHLCYKEGIDCKEVSSNGVIHHNLVHDNLRQGLYVDCWFGLLYDVEFHSNVVYNCEWGLALSAEGLNASMKNIKIFNNILYDNRGSGILFGVWGNDEIRSDIYIYNNTIHNNGTSGHWAGPTGGIDIRSRKLNNIHIYNNICSNNWAFEIGIFENPENPEDYLEKQKLFIENNLSAKFKSKPNEKGIFPPVYGMLGQNSLQGDPGYKDIENKDFSLTQTSKARNRAKADALYYISNDIGANLLIIKAD